LHARIDGRLAPERMEAVEDYLAAHPDERERWAQYAEQREALRAAFAAQTTTPIPSRLRIARLLTERHLRRRRRLAQIAAAIGILILGGIGGWTARDVAPNLTSSASNVLADTVFEAILAHRTFSVETRHPVEVSAGEEAHLVQWLSKRLGHRLIAPDLSALGFRLMGGRLLPAADSGPAALFMYEDGKGTRLSAYYLSVDVAGQTEFKYREQDGVSAFYWIEDGLAYAIAANAPRDLLLKIAEIVYQQNSPDSAKAKIPPIQEKPS
jgi:anti-sigma factor RsiW